MLDNNYFYSVDLNKKDGDEGEDKCVLNLVPISVGIGGYMPRYLSRCMADGPGYATAHIRMRNMLNFDVV